MYCEAFSLLISRTRNHIRELLASGTTVICDRFFHSGVVYSAAKMNKSLTLPWARAPDQGLPRPDVVLFLDLDEAAAKARGGWGGEVYEKEEMQKRVRELFWALSMGGKDIQGQALLREVEGVTSGSESGRGSSDLGQWRRQDEEDIVVVDAAGSKEEVAEDIWAKVERRVEQVDKGELGRIVRTAL